MGQDTAILTGLVSDAFVGLRNKIVDIFKCPSNLILLGVKFFKQAVQAPLFICFIWLCSKDLLAAFVAGPIYSFTFFYLLGSMREETKSERLYELWDGVVFWSVVACIVFDLISIIKYIFF